MTEQRSEVLAEVADAIDRQGGSRVLVGIDGRPGSGKSTFADEVAGLLQARGRNVVRSTTDSFHKPRADRGRRGATSAEGYLLDSHQLDAIIAELLAPFRAGRPTVHTAAFDEPSDRPVNGITHVREDAVPVFDGLFIHRDELVPFWNITVLIEADHRCDREWLTYLEADLPTHPTVRAISDAGSDMDAS